MLMNIFLFDFIYFIRKLYLIKNKFKIFNIILNIFYINFENVN